MKNLNKIHLGGLRAVETVGRLGSLRAAAEEMGVTVGAVSQQVQKVEGQLGRSLFERHPKGLSPTTLGREVVRHLTSGLGELSAAVDLARRSHDDSLIVSVPPVFAAKWLVWRLKSFNDAHPATRIRVDASVAMIDPDSSDVDVCVRVGRGDWPNVKLDKLLEQRVFPVCSPTLAERILAPADLTGIPVIRDRNALFDWSVWLGPNGLDESLLSDGPTFSDAALCLDAAIAGQGVFLAWETLAQFAVSSGRLIAPFPDRYGTGAFYWFVTGRRGRESQKVKNFKAWLRAELESDRFSLIQRKP